MHQLENPDLQRYFSETRFARSSGSGMKFKRTFASLLSLGYGIPPDYTLHMLRVATITQQWFVTLNSESPSYGNDSRQIRQDWPDLRQVQDVDDTNYYS